MNTIKLNTIGERPIKKGGASGSGGGGNYVYYSGTMRDFSIVLSLASMAKVAADSGIIYYSMGMALYPDTFTSETNIIGAGFDLSMKISHPVSGELTTVGDVLTELGVDWTQITEEEFYKIPTQFTLMYGDEPKTFFYIEGMAWGEWVNSDYNDGDFRIEESNLGEGVTSYVEYRGDVVRAEVDYDYGYVKPHRQIQSDIRYWRPVGGPI